MSKTDIKKRIKKLRDEINFYRHQYHVLDNLEISEAALDSLKKELYDLEADNPELITRHSPTQRVAGVALDKFEKTKHKVSQWSFDDAFSREDLDNWQEKIFNFLQKNTGKRPKSIEYVCELKIDGLHIVFTYKNGLLDLAATRGDGTVGENVTQNIRTIESVPLEINEPIDIIVEGEVWLGRKMLEKINKSRLNNNEVPFANPRNAAAGTIRQLNSKVVASRKLDVFVYDISDGKIPSSQQKELNRLSELGFKVNKHEKLCKNLDDVVDFWDKWKKRKDSEDYWIDGVVIKVNERYLQEVLGYTGKSPRFAIAFKFPADQATSKIEEVYVQVGRTGALTPVARIQPVQLAGTTVTHSTLHNFDEINRLDLRVGDTVILEKAGDVIPKIIQVLPRFRSGNEKKIITPTKCPVCSSDVSRRSLQYGKESMGAILYCKNKNCFAQEMERISHFVSKKVFNIDHCGPKIVEQLINEGMIKDASDLFILTVGDLEELDRFGKKSSNNLVKAIENAKNISLARFINSLSIPHIGVETAEELANYFQSFEKFKNSNFEILRNVDGVGEKVAKAVVEYFEDKDNLIFANKLIENGVRIINPKIVQKNKLKLFGQSFVITGSLEEMTRDEIKEKIKNLGGDVSSSISKKITALIVGKNPGSKYSKAKKLDIKIIDEKEFLKILRV